MSGHMEVKERTHKQVLRWEQPVPRSLAALTLTRRFRIVVAEILGRGKGISLGCDQVAPDVCDPRKGHTRHSVVGKVTCAHTIPCPFKLLL